MRILLETLCIEVRLLIITYFLAILLFEHPVLRFITVSTQLLKKRQQNCILLKSRFCRIKNLQLHKDSPCNFNAGVSLTRKSNQRQTGFIAIHFRNPCSNSEIYPGADSRGVARGAHAPPFFAITCFFFFLQLL